MTEQRIPTVFEISPTIGRSDDERTALEHFLGKSIDQAAGLFTENCSYYQDDLLYMGTYGFQYYFQAYARIVQSDNLTGFQDALLGLLFVLRTRLQKDYESVVGISHCIAELLDYCLVNFDKYCVDSDISSEVRDELMRLRKNPPFIKA